MEPLEKITENNLSKTIFLQKKIVFGVIVIFGVLILFNFLFLSAPKNFPAGQVVSVKEGTSLRFLSKELKNENVIRSRTMFETFVIAYGGEKYLVPGDYLFEKKLPVFQIARRMAKGKYNLAPVKVTIPEGFDLKQIADTFSAKLVNFNKNNFLTEAKDKEGYLFPDTYFFSSSSNEQDVLKYMSNNFNQKISSIQSQINSSAKSEKEIIIMASLIEREAKGDSDRAVISGILWNRISQKMLLQVDSAPETYKTKGLPANPICNPGLKAIEAAIHPLNSPYLYYLHDKDGIIHYARTFAEHKQNKLKYLN